MNKKYLRQHCRLATGDLDQAREHVSRLWERHESYLLSGRKYGLRWHQAELDQTSLAYAETPSRLKVICGPVGDCYRISLHETGAVHHVINGREVSATPEQAVLHVPGEDLALETVPFRKFILTFTRSKVDGALYRRFDHVPKLAETSLVVPMITPQVGTLQSLCRWTADELDRPQSGLCTSPQAAASLERTLLALFLDGISALCPETSRRDYMATARLAHIEAWMEAHFADPIGVEEMAAVAGVSVRSVQAAFRRIRGCSPMEALICLRLDRAHELLKTAGPDVRVTDVATECGFFHFGRFAQQYRKRFGEPPSATLLRAAGAGPTLS
ncbi:MAG: helix-turn-helix domain-containing protein [Rhodospirillales bacterium]